MAHDAVTRWLSSSDWTPSDLWNDIKQLVDPAAGYLIADDTLLDKRYARANELAKVQYSGNEHQLVNGINLVNMLWTDGERFVPVDYRVYRKPEDDKTKNDHCKDMLKRAKQRHFVPRYVLMDSWYASIDNIKYITRTLGWHVICDLKKNRQVSVTKGTYLPVADLDLADKQVRKVWLKAYGFVLVAKTVHEDGDVRYLATDDLSLTDRDTLIGHHQHRWKIEEYHRALKQTTGIAKCAARRTRPQLTHIYAAVTAFVRLERERLQTAVSWYEQKARIARVGTRTYMAANA
jgi:hypothetical protein